MTRHFSFLRTTAIGGIFFLLPLVVLGVLIGQVAQVVYVVAKAIQPYSPVNDTMGYVLIFLVAILIIVLACFVAGIMARRSLARQFTRWVEKYLLMLFPRYAIFKEQLSGNIGGDVAKNTLRPVCIQMEGYTRLAFEVEHAPPSKTTENDPSAPEPSNQWHLKDTVTVYLPGSPDPWNGTVINLAPERVHRLDVPFPDTLGAFEKLGVDTQKLVRELPVMH